MIVTILSTSPSPLLCRISACLLASSVRTDPFAEHLTQVQNPGGWALQLHGDFCSRVQLGGPPGHERRIEGSRSTSIGEGNISCFENLTCSHGSVYVDICLLSCVNVAGPTSSWTETPWLLTPNVSDCAEVPRASANCLNCLFAGRNNNSFDLLSSPGN